MLNQPFHLRWKQLGGHVHVAVFIRTGDLSFAKSGALVFSPEEWRIFQSTLKSEMFTISEEE